MSSPEKIKRVSASIQEKIGIVQADTVGVVLGTGLGGSLAAMEESGSIPYQDLPGLPVSTVESHKGQVISGIIGGKLVLVMQGRFHLYEGYSAQEVVMPVRVLWELGVRTLVVTNAAGALNPVFDTGGLMLITDHINMTGESPLRGPNHDPWGPRFPDMCAVYDRKLRDLALDAATETGIRLERGVYLQVTGPNLETPAETRAFRHLGADAVGMSTAVEALCARHMGMRVLGISCLTNKNLPDCMAEVSLEEVIDRAERSSAELGRLLESFLQRLRGQP